MMAKYRYFINYEACTAPEEKNELYYKLIYETAAFIPLQITGLKDMGVQKMFLEGLK